MSTSFTGLTAVTTLATTDILAGDVSGTTAKITAGNLRKAFFGFSASDPINTGPATIVGNSTITGTLSGISTLTCTTLICSNFTGNVTGNVSGNAATATAVAASGITGTTLASNVVTASLTTLGTIANLNATLFSIAAGASASKLLTTSFVWDIPSVNSLANTSTDITVTGAVAGDFVYAVDTVGAATPAFKFTAFVVSPDTVRVYAINGSSGAVDPISATYKLFVLRLT